MFGSVFSSVSSLFSQRFVVGLLLPVIAFLAGVAAVVATSLGWHSVLSWGEHLNGLDLAMVVGAFFTLAILVAILMGTQVLPLTRLLEGYWPKTIRERATRLQVRRLQRVPASETGDQIRYQRFPPEQEQLLPTTLGNVLRAAERYPGDAARWGLDGVFWWPRLYLLMPDSARNQVDDARAGLDQMVILTWLSWGFGVLVLGFAGSVPRAVWLPCAGGGAILGWLSYRAAISAAVIFGELVRSSFDLYRIELLAALGWMVPDNWPDERQLWHGLSQQLFRRGTDDELERLIYSQRIFMPRQPGQVDDYLQAAAASRPAAPSTPDEGTADGSPSQP